MRDIAGAMTDSVAMHTQQAYAQPAANLSDENLELHLTGDAHFETNFVGSSSSNAYQAGLGPVQNNTNCDKCHPSDGRASLPYVPHKFFDDTMFEDVNGWRKLRSSGVFLRISIENDAINSAPKTKDNCWGSPVPVPNFSDQLFNRGSLGARPLAEGLNAGQADVWMKYETRTVTYPDGGTVELSRPIFKVDNPYDAPDDSKVYNPIVQKSDSASRLFRDDVKFGPRIGLPMYGLGLLDSIKESDILALVDINDSDGDGITGKPNWVCDQEKVNFCKDSKNNFSCEENPPISLGRYGWKANTPTVAHQGLGAMRGDMGVTNPLFKNESIKGTDLMVQYKAYVQANFGDTFKTYDDNNDSADIDATMEQAQSIVFYSETLAVPARRNVDDKDVQKGGKLFSTVGCVKCHVPSFVTGTKSGSYSKDSDRNPYLAGDKQSSKSKIAELENQKIYPFTDMLLHDMGLDLADGRRDGDANGNEWKTRPLWGIGLTQKVNPVAGFLHDGRARTIEEAILWHGGEADGIKNEFMKLPKADRDAMVKFLENL